jgi:hypothetical protein
MRPFDKLRVKVLRQAQGEASFFALILRSAFAEASADTIQRTNPAKL